MAPPRSPHRAEAARQVPVRKPGPSNAAGKRVPAQEKRRRILEAARSVCAESGYDAARMEEIAARARVSKGTIYHHFESKLHLFLSTVLESHVDSDRRLAAGPTPSADPLTQIDQLLGSMTDALVAVSQDMTVNLQVWGVLVQDSEGRARLHRELHQIYERRTDSIRETLAAGRGSGAFRDDLDFDAFAAGLLAIFDGFVYRSVFDPAHANPAELRRCFDALIRDTIVRESSAGEGLRRA